MQTTMEQKNQFRNYLLSELEDGESDEVDAVLRVMERENLSLTDVADLLDDTMKGRLLKSFADRKMIRGAVSLW